jgi:hypothetical protein
VKKSREHRRQASQAFDSLFQQVLSAEVTEYLPEWKESDPDVFQNIIKLAKKELRVDYL